MDINLKIYIYSCHKLTSIDQTAVPYDLEEYIRRKWTSQELENNNFFMKMHSQNRIKTNEDLDQMDGSKKHDQPALVLKK